LPRCSRGIVFRLAKALSERRDISLLSECVLRFPPPPPPWRRKSKPIEGGKNRHLQRPGRTCEIFSRIEMILPLIMSIAAGNTLVHCSLPDATAFQRDELAILEDGRNLAGGYVDYPPTHSILRAAWRWLIWHLRWSDSDSLRARCRLSASS